MDDFRFWWFHADDNNRRDIQTSLGADELVPIVDEDEGGIIGYALSANFADRIVSALNK